MKNEFESIRRDLPNSLLGGTAAFSFAIMAMQTEGVTSFALFTSSAILGTGSALLMARAYSGLNRACKESEAETSSQKSVQERRFETGEPS